MNPEAITRFQETGGCYRRVATLVLDMITGVLFGLRQRAYRSHELQS